MFTSKLANGGSCRRRAALLCILGGIFLSGPIVGQAPPVGVIKGEVRSSVNQNPVQGVTVLVKGGMRAPVVTDAAGRFELGDVPVGVRLVEFAGLGFKPLTQADIRVLPNQAVTLQIALTPTLTTHETVTVTAGLFEGEQGAVSS